MPPKNRKKASNSSSNPSEDPGTSPLRKPPKRTSNKKSGKKKSSRSPYTWTAGAVGVAAFSWWYSNRQQTPAQRFIANFVCRAPGGFCHNALIPKRRTQVAIRTIHKGEKVLQVPRTLQIWDLDAIRDPFVRNELLEARHIMTQRPLDAGAFLAAYLVLRSAPPRGNSQNKKDDVAKDPMRPYFDILPTYEELVEYHPALWNESAIEFLGNTSSSFAVAKGYQDMIDEEYAAFIKVSPKFAELVSKKDYGTMRVNVFSRSFRADPPGPQEALSDMSLEEELEFYNLTAGVDLTLGCYAMVPVLDMYDHHARPNVQWKYDPETRAFVVYAAPGGIPAGSEVMDSYGKYTDSHLFAKYGFVNGDGSDYTQASIAAMHKPLDIGIPQFSYVPVGGPGPTLMSVLYQAMVRYLQFDDGYEECVEPNTQPEAFEFKRLKLEHLVRIANQADRWITHVGPRNRYSRPARSTMFPITLDIPRFQGLEGFEVMGKKALPTCRLMVLHHEDYNGTAIDLLTKGLEVKDFILSEPGSPELEYRSFLCLVRLIGYKLWRYQADEEAEIERLYELNQNAFGSRNWTLAHVRLGEVLTLDLLRRIALSGAGMNEDLIKQKLNDTSDEILPTFRTSLCPEEYTELLLKT